MRPPRWKRKCAPAASKVALSPLSSNAALADFDEADLAHAVSLIRDRAAQLPQQHAELLDVFAGVANRFDEEAYARHLADEAMRARFHRLLSAFRRSLEMAQVSRETVAGQRCIKAQTARPTPIAVSRRGRAAKAPSRRTRRSDADEAMHVLPAPARTTLAAAAHRL